MDDEVRANLLAGSHAILLQRGVSASSAHAEPSPEPLLPANALCEADELLHFVQLDEADLAVVEPGHRLRGIGLASVVLVF